MAVDWKNTNRTDVWKVEMVDPINLESSRGYLTDIEEINITYGYYTETRSGATVKTLGDGGYIENSQLRIIHEVPEWGYQEVLFTGFVTGKSPIWYQGECEVTYTLSSDLYGLKVDLHRTDFTCGAGSTAIGSASLLMDYCSRPHKLITGYTDYIFSTAKVFTIGENLLSTVSELCDLANCRYSVDGYGYVTIRAYIPPSHKTPSVVLDENDSRSMLIQNQIQETSNESELPGEVLVTSGSGDTKISGWAMVPSGSILHPSRRGYNYVELQEVSELNPNTAEAAALKAKTLLQNDTVIREWSVDSLYFPTRDGDVFRYIGAGGDRNVLLKSVDINCMQGTQKMTLKEV